MITAATPLSSRPVSSRKADEPARPDTGDRLALWAVAIAIAGLPLLTPQGPSNTAPADLFILFAIAASLLWAAKTRQRLRFPYAAGVATMVAAGCIAAIFGNYPKEGLIAVIIDLFLLAWVTTLATVGRSEASAGFVLRAWCVTGSIWGAAFALFTVATSGITAAGSARVGFTLGEQNGAGLYFALTVLVILAGRCPRQLRWRVPVIACLIFDLLLTGSLAGIGGLLVGLALAVVVSAAAGSAGRQRWC